MIKQQQQQQQVFMEENMSNLTSTAYSGEASGSSSNHQQYFSQQNQSQEQPPPKKRRNLPGNPDPDAEVIALSPRTLLATNRFVCEICNKGFQRDQNLQLHRRGHNLPWKLKLRTSKEVKKKVYICPETSCVHHDPSRALGDLTGIKKHFCRKHGEKKWKCEKCSKRYAVQSDWKAHSKVCGTREYRCDCGTLFSRRDSFITHRAFCDALAEETARAITTTTATTNSSVLFLNPVTAGTSSASHLINSNLQQSTPNIQLDNNNIINNNIIINNNPLHAFPLKREPQNQNLMMINNHLPPWLACPPIDHHFPSPSSSSSIIFHHHQDNHHHHNQVIITDPISPNNNNNIINNNPAISMGPTSFPSALPHMSATALLQKAAQMGATMSKSTTTTTALPPQCGHVSDNSNTNSNTAGLFGLNLSSRDHGLSSFGNKPATTTTTTITGTGTNTGSDQTARPSPGTGPTHAPSSFFHDMMMSSLSSSYDHHHEDAFGAFHQTLGERENVNGSGGGGGNDGLTRDFLGLRPLSHSDILTIAGLGNCMATNTTTTSHHDHQHDDTHKPWQG